METKRGAHSSAHTKPRHELADIVRTHAYKLGRLPPAHAKVLRAVGQCRTSALGGHLEQCTSCGFGRNAYNSCRNRHCPKCQSLARHRWVERRKERLLPTHYFHVVFTLPAELRQLARCHPVIVFDLLFKTATETLQALAADERHLGGQLGMTAILHTWNRNLTYHPHLHCVVTGGALSRDGSVWRKTSPSYLFPVRVLGRLFRGKFLAGLRQLAEEGALRDVSLQDLTPLLSKLYRKNWVVYAKEPFGSAEHVFQYLGRYTHRIAISNHRIQRVSDSAITFSTRHGQSATLPPDLFLRRYLQHVVPARYVRIRHYGLCAPANVHTRLERARQLIEEGGTFTPRRLQKTPEKDFRSLLSELTGVDLRLCPACATVAMQRSALPQSRAPPGPGCPSL